MGEKLEITSKTKVYDLLENYPQLEDVLIRLIPGFWKLKNPFLRKTVAKVISLRQAAEIGEMKTETLVNRLKKEAGENPG